MRAAVLDDGVTIRDWDDPQAGPGEVLVAPQKVGICGSDVHFAIDGTAVPRFRPIILGHEAMGVVVAAGPDTDAPPPGTRVSIIPLISCHACDQCRRGRTVLCRTSACLGAEVHGAWADLIAVPARNVVPVPAGLSDELAAVATDSVATAFHAVRTRGRVAAGHRVAVWGTGGLGLSAVGAARALGAAEVIAVDPRPEARQWALDSGADLALDPENALAEITARGGVDTALEFVGRPETVELAVRSLDAGGIAVAVGIGAGKVTASHLMTMVVRERSLVGSYGNEPEEVVEVLDLMASGRLVLPHVVGDVIAMTDAWQGLQRVHAGDTGGSRIVLDIGR
jgi:D-arabinose 1-dehydrogenase-like Zn-dependent alcohol dehydrogenase